ncbi:unnamed protein product [Trichobilharzia szidati]|nr:unnamed protein product [Trichobilharzia szidati]
MLEELSVRELNSVHSSGGWTPSSNRSRSSRCRESYCSDIDLLPPLYKTVITDNQLEGNNQTGDMTPVVAVSDDDADVDGDNEENLMNWLMKQFKENGLDSQHNLTPNNLDKVDAFTDLNEINKTPSVENNLPKDDTRSSISSFQGILDSLKVKASNNFVIMNNQLSRNSRERCDSKQQQQHYFPRMYPPVRDSSTESRRLCVCGANKLDAYMTATSPMMRNSKHHCKLMNDLFHQITKKLGSLHDCDTQIIGELQNASKIIKDLKSRASSGPVTPSPQCSSQHYQHLYRSQASTPDACKSSNNSLRKQTVIKHFPKKRSTNYLNEAPEWPGGDNKHADSVYSPQLDNRSSYDEKDHQKSPYLNGLFPAINERRLTQRKFTESPWGPITVEKVSNSSTDFDHHARISNQLWMKNENPSKYIKSLKKSSLSTTNLDQSSNESIATSNRSMPRSKLPNNERFSSQLTLPMYSSNTLRNKSPTSNVLNTPEEINQSLENNNSMKLIMSKGIQSLLKSPFRRKACTPGPNNNNHFGMLNPLKLQGRSVSLAQIHLPDETSTLKYVSNDQLNKSGYKLDVPYSKPLLLKELAKPKA